MNTSAMLEYRVIVHAIRTNTQDTPWIITELIVYSEVLRTEASELD